MAIIQTIPDIFLKYVNYELFTKFSSIIKTSNLQSQLFKKHFINKIQNTFHGIQKRFDEI